MKSPTSKTETNRSKKGQSRLARTAAASAAGGMLAVGLVGVSTVNAPASQALEWPGAGDVFSAGMSIYQMAARCKANLDNDIDCMQSTDTSIAEIHKMTKELTTKLDAYIATYNRDQKYTSAALENIISNQADDYVRQEMEKVEVDLENSHVGLKLYQNFVACVDAATAPDATSPTCPKLNIFAINEGTQPANVRSIINAANLFMDRQTASKEGVGGYNPDPALFAKRVGGTTMNPYKSWSLLNAVLKREENIERVKQGLPAGTPLRYMSAAYVNHIGNVTNQITTLEENYFSVRELATAMDGNEDLASSLASIANNGRDDASPILSIAQQRRAFSFPGWTAENQMPANQGYMVAPRTGMVKVVNRGTSSNINEDAWTPTEQQAVNFATDIGESGTTYSKLRSLSPESLPGADGQQGLGNPSAQARIWTKPQPLEMVTLQTEYSDSSKRRRYSASRSETSSFGRAIQLWGRVGAGQVSRLDGNSSGSVPFSILDTAGGAKSGGSTSHLTNDDWFNFNEIPAAYAVPVTRSYTLRHHSGCDAVKMGPKIRNVCVSQDDTEIGGAYSVLASIKGYTAAGPAAGLKPASNLDLIPVEAGGVLQAADSQG